MSENPADNLEPWIHFFKTLMDRPIVPVELSSFTEDMNEIAIRDKSIQWKIKGIAS